MGYVARARTGVTGRQLIGDMDICHVTPDLNPLTVGTSWDTEEARIESTTKLGMLLDKPRYAFIADVALKDGHLASAHVTFGKHKNMVIVNVTRRDGGIDRYAAKGMRYLKNWRE